MMQDARPIDSIRASTHVRDEVGTDHLRWLVLLIAILGGTVATLFLVLSVIRPFMGADLSLRGSTWSVQELDPNGLARHSGIKPGDVALTVNGWPAAEVAGVKNIIRGRDITSLVVVGEDGRERLVSTEEGAVPGSQVLEAAIYYLIGFAFWLIALLAFMRKPAVAAVRRLLVLGAFVAVGLTAVSAQDRGVPFAIQVEFASHLAIGPLFADLFLTFPYDKWRKKGIGYLMYAPSLVALVLFLAMHGQSDTDYWSRVTVLPILSVGVIVGLVSLVHSSLKAGYVRMKQQARIVMTGAMVGVLPFMALSVVPFIAVQETLVPPQYSIVALIALPASIAYALVRHRLFDIDLAIRRSVAYGLLSLAMAGMYMGVVSLIGVTLGGTAPVLRFMVIVLVGAVGLVTFAPVRNRLQSAIDRKFYRDRHDYREVLKSAISSLAKMTDQSEIAHFIAASASELLGLFGACLLLYTKQGYLYAKEAVGVYVDAPRHSGLISRAGNLKESAMFPNMAPESHGAAFFIPLQAGGRRIGTLCLGHKASREGFTVDDISFLHTFATQAAAALENARLFAEAGEHRLELERAYDQLQQSAEELSRRKKELEDAYLGMARTLVLTLESRDPYTRGHSERVSGLVQRIARNLGIAGEELQKLELAARLHDIGKTGVADAILLKPGAFDPGERAEIERHPTRGVEILRFLDFLKDVLPVIESHHEWYNGTGYPRGLRGEEIPLGGRIMAVADAYDAMVSKRPHRAALPHDEAIRRLGEGSGTQWDPKIVDAFIKSEPRMRG